MLFIFNNLYSKNSGKLLAFLNFFLRNGTLRKSYGKNDLFLRMYLWRIPSLGGFFKIPLSFDDSHCSRCLNIVSNLASIASHWILSLFSFTRWRSGVFQVTPGWRWRRCRRSFLALLPTPFTSSTFSICFTFYSSGFEFVLIWQTESLELNTYTQPLKLDISKKFLKEL